MRSQRGITLIALVVTIIVMLILVGTVVSVSINGGLFGYADKATTDWEAQQKAEAGLGSDTILKVDGTQVSGTINQIVDAYRATATVE